jgi:uncharacterized protein (DUF1800 family)
MHPLTQPASAATLLGSAALAACGGGDGGGDGGALPAAFDAVSARTPRRQILGASVLSASVDRTSSSASALLPSPAAAAAPAPVPSASELMDWAEHAYSSYFPGPQTDQTSAPYLYRYYPATGNYLGVSNGRVYIYGPVAGDTTEVVDVGALSDFAERLQALHVPADDAQAARFLLQATLGCTDEAIASVRALGYDAWLTQELARPGSLSNWQFLIDKGIADDLDNRNNRIGTDPAIWQRLIGAEDSLRQRVALALSEIFVVGFDGIGGPWRQFQLAAWWDLLSSHAFGTYRALLEAVTLNAAMGKYLSTAGNQKEDAATGRLPDENYAREVMQLFSIGLVELQPDGTPKLDAQGRSIDTYTQDTVSQLARVFTGWNLDSSPFESGPEVMQRPMVLNANRHSTLAVDALGMHIPANTEGSVALGMTLDTLAAHPNVGPFLGRQLIQRLVTSNPSAAYVARVAAAFADNGLGVRGDLSAVVRAVLIDDEARDPSRSADPAYGKLREPVLRFVSWARSFKATTISGNWNIGDLSNAANRLGQSPLRSPSVFNFYRPGYVPAGTAMASAALVAPEFQITNESTVAGYLNFMQTVIPGGTRFDLRPDYSSELALATNATGLVDRVQLLLGASSLDADSRSTIINAVNGMSAGTDSQRLNRVQAAILLVLASPAVQVQK